MPPPAALTGLYRSKTSSSRNITYSDLHNSDIKRLANVLSSAPDVDSTEPLLTYRDLRSASRPAARSTCTHPFTPDAHAACNASRIQRVENAIRDLPHHLRSSSQGKALSNPLDEHGVVKPGKLCPLHSGLNHQLIYSMWNEVRYEFERGCGKFLYPLLMYCNPPASYQWNMRQLEPVLEMWQKDFDIADHTPPGHEPMREYQILCNRQTVRKWTKQKNGCPACLLARIGSDANVCRTLFAVMVARYPSGNVQKERMKSKRARLVRCWVEQFGQDGWVDQDWEFGMKLRRHRKHWKESKRVASGRGFYGRQALREGEGAAQNYPAPQAPPFPTRQEWPGEQTASPQRTDSPQSDHGTYMSGGLPPTPIFMQGGLRDSVQSDVGIDISTPFSPPAPHLRERPGSSQSSATVESNVVDYTKPKPMENIRIQQLRTGAGQRPRRIFNNQDQHFADVAYTETEPGTPMNGVQGGAAGGQLPTRVSGIPSIHSRAAVFCSASNASSSQPCTPRHSSQVGYDTRIVQPLTARFAGIRISGVPSIQAEGSSVALPHRSWNSNSDTSGAGTPGHTTPRPISLFQLSYNTRIQTPLSENFADQQQTPRSIYFPAQEQYSRNSADPSSSSLYSIQGPAAGTTTPYSPLPWGTMSQGSAIPTPLGGSRPGTPRHESDTLPATPRQNNPSAARVDSVVDSQRGRTPRLITPVGTTETPATSRGSSPPTPTAESVKDSEYGGTRRGTPRSDTSREDSAIDRRFGGKIWTPNRRSMYGGYNAYDDVSPLDSPVELREGHQEYDVSREGSAEP